MLTLFERMERPDDDTSAGYSEPIWKYLNRAGRPGFDYVRAQPESWFSYFDAEEKTRTALAKRFRSREDDYHLSAFFELYLHAIFRNLGYRLTIEPEFNNRKPDFLIELPNGQTIVVEAVANYPERLYGTGRLEVNSVYDYLNRNVKSSDYSLSVKVHRSFSSRLSRRQLASDVQQWLNCLDYDAVCDLASQESQDRKSHLLPKYEWPQPGGPIQIEALPKPPTSRYETNRIVVMMPGEVETICTSDEIRNTINAKAKRYGKLEIPYVLAVNASEASLDEVDIANVLFGDEQLTLYDDGTARRTRKPNGIWDGRNGIQNTTLSGVLFFKRVHATSIHRVEPVLWLNPDAKNSLDYALPFAAVKVNQTGHFVSSPASKRIQEVLGIDPEKMPF